jgi:membrane-associated phospholipid phosphatase
MSDTAASIEARSGPGNARGSRALLIAATALGIFVGLGLAVSAHPGTGIDGAIRQWALAANRPAGVAVFAFVSTAGSVTPMIVYACVGVAFVAIFRRSMVPLTALFAPVAAVVAYLGTKSIVLRARPSGNGNAFEGTYSFPSAHATTSSAVSCAVAYVLYREGFVSGGVALGGATAIALVIGMSRVYLDVHWASDVVGGWCLGLAIGALSSVLYEYAAGAAPLRVTEPSR